MNETTRLSSTRLRNFFVQLCKNAKAMDDKRRKKEEIARHLERIKRIYIEKGPRKNLEQELGLLSSKINDIISKETVIAKKQEEEDLLLKKLQARVEQIGITPMQQTKQVEDFQKISKTLQENISKIRELTQGMANEEDERMRHVEEKIEKTAGLTQAEIKDIEEKLERLEKEHRKLKRKGKEKKRIASIGSKIRKQKEILKKIKYS